MCLLLQSVLTSNSKTLEWFIVEKKNFRKREERRHVKGADPWVRLYNGVPSGHVADAADLTIGSQVWFGLVQLLTYNDGYRRPRSFLGP